MTSKYISGLVTAAHGRHYFVELPDGETIKCFPRGKKPGLQWAIKSMC